MKPIYKLLNKEFVLFLITTILMITIPTLITNFDNWDGVIIDNAIRTKNFSGVYNWWREGAYHAFHIWTFIVSMLSTLFNPSTTRIIHSSLTFLLFQYTLFKFLKSLYSPSNNLATAIISISISMVVSPFLYSSIFTPMMFSLALSLYGVSLLKYDSKKSLLAAMTLIILGLSYFHAIPFIIIMAGFVFISKALQKDILIKSILRFLSFSGLISILFVFIYKIIWKSHGLYQTYSSISPSLKILKSNIKNIIVTHPFILAPILLIVVIILLFRIQKRWSLDSILKDKFTLSLILIALSIVANTILFSINNRQLDFKVIRQFSDIQNHIQLRYILPFFISAMTFVYILIEHISIHFHSKTRFIYLLIIPLCMAFSIQKWRYNLKVDRHMNQAVSYFQKIDFSSGDICAISINSPIYRYGTNYQINYLHTFAKNGLPGQICRENQELKCINHYKSLCSLNALEYSAKYIFSPQICDIVKLQTSVKPCLLLK